MRARIAGLVGSAAVGLALGTSPAPVATADAPREIAIERDGVDVTTDVAVRPGTYRVRDLDGDGVLRVKADGVTVSLEGVVLDGSADGQERDAFDGVGISVVGRKGVTIRGGAVRGFRVGVRGEDAPQVLVRGVDVSHNRAMRLRSTPRREDESDWLWPHENDAGEWETRYGAGISLTRCAEASVTGCRARGTQNGLLLTRCDRSQVRLCDLSFLSGWGLAMYRSSLCVVDGNRFDFCVRGYSHRVYARGQDSAGILVFEQCSDNRFTRNSATHSGDGFFLYAGNETLRRTGSGGCNRNALEGNDFSHAVANGIEATFSEGNRFLRNRLDDCDHGVWAGYSYGTHVSLSSIVGCQHGVSIEHGHRNLVGGNAIERADVGVHLWWDDDRDLLGSPYGKAQDTSSSGNTVEGNWIEECGTAIRLDGDRGSKVLRNRVRGGRVALDLRGATENLTVEGNRVEAPVSVASDAGAALRLGANAFDPFATTGKGDVLRGPPLGEAEPIARTAVGPDDFDGRPFLPRSAPRGREHIVIGEWGPLDPSEPGLVPAAQSASGPATLRVVGARLPFRVVSLTKGFVLDPATGIAPATVTVRPEGETSGASVPFEVVLRVGETDLRAKGTVTTATWRVRWWKWTKDPRTEEAAFSALLATPPADEATTNGLDFAWGGGAPSAKVGGDRFATVAETTVTVPAGRWRVRTTSDDGIRVFVDGKRVIDDWTWHAPKEHVADLDLAAGSHAIRVEHFEIDGWAVLRAAMEPVPR